MIATVSDTIASLSQIACSSFKTTGRLPPPDRRRVDEPVKVRAAIDQVIVAASV